MGALVACLLLFGLPAWSEGTDGTHAEGKVEPFLPHGNIRVDVGTNLSSLMLFIPMPQIALNFDISFFRVGLSFHAYILKEEWDHRFEYGATVNPGFVFPLVDHRKEPGGVFQLSAPLVATIGVADVCRASMNDTGDCLDWVIVGPMTGLDFTWWRWKNVGVDLSVQIGMPFRVKDLGSEYWDSYEPGKTELEKDGYYFEGSFLLGVAL
jgi:hypothetical protein